MGVFDYITVLLPNLVRSDMSPVKQALVVSTSILKCMKTASSIPILRRGEYPSFKDMAHERNKFETFTMEVGKGQE